MSWDGYRSDQLASELGVPSCLVLDRATSTLDVTHELAADGAPAGTLVLADEQTQGRGRRGGHWYSPPGSGIWLGFLVRPRRAPAGGGLALRVGLAVVSTLTELSVSAQMKWPNDVMIADRKAAGILCEARWRGNEVSWIAVGIGINVSGPLPPEVADRAIAVSDVAPGVSRMAILKPLVARMQALPDEPNLTDDEIERYERHSWLHNRTLAEPVVGSVLGVDRTGALLVRTPYGTVPVTGGPVVTA